MPKVTDEYVADKRDYILECTGEILKEKPLYLITMRDIIKKAGFSHGIIYHYYANLDEIYVDFINKYTSCSPLESKIDELLNSNQEEKAILTECFITLGNYLEEILKSVIGKAFFELTVLYAYDIEKRATLFPKLQFKCSLAYAQNRIVEYTLRNIEKGIFHPQISPQSIIIFVNSFIDGIGQSEAIATESDNHSSESNPTISEMFQVLAKAVIHFLEE